MTRRLAAVVAAAACLVSVRGGAQAPGTLVPGARGGFVLLAGADTFAVEHVTRTAGGFEGELFVRDTRLRVGYAVTTETDARVQRVALYQWAPGADETQRPIGSLQFRFVGDSVIVAPGTPGAPERRAALTPGTLPWVNPSMAFAEQIARRARRMGATIDGLQRAIPLVDLGGRQAVIVATAVGRDSMVLDFGGLTMRLAVDSVGSVLGGAVPAQRLTIRRVAALGPTAGRGRPAYGPPPGAPYVAEEVRIPAGQGTVLVGTLTRPTAARGPVPVVVTISGSGPQDRDSHVQGLGDYRPFRAIADTLGRRGIGVLRFDERGVGASSGAFGTATTRDFAADVRTVLAWLRARPDVDATRLALLGHSEGGLVAPMVAADDPGLAGMVLMAAPALPGRAILEHQARAGILRDTTQPRARRDALLAQLPRSLDSALAGNAWLRELAAYDPRPTLRRVRTPTLVLQGTSDQQVTADQADTIVAALRAAGNRAVARRVFPDVDHLFLHDPNGDPTRYWALPGQQLPAAVLGSIADWLVATLRPGGAAPTRR